jgi:hypothetical protein
MRCANGPKLSKDPSVAHPFFKGFPERLARHPRDSIARDLQSSEVQPATSGITFSPIANEGNIKMLYEVIGVVRNHQVPSSTTSLT